MRVDNTDLRSIQEADKLPEEIVTVEIARVREAKPPDEWLADGNRPEDFQSPWSYASCRVIEFNDASLNTPELIGREIDMTLVNEWRGRQGLHELVKHKVQYNPEEGWDQGIPADENGARDTKNLKGVRFKGKIRSFETKKGPRQEIRPLLY